MDAISKNPASRKLWLLWDGSKSAVIGMQLDQPGDLAYQGLYLVVGHSGVDTSGTRPAQGRELLGCFEIREHQEVRCAVSLSKGETHIEVLFVQRDVLMPVKTFMLTSINAIAGDDLQTSYVILASNVADDPDQPNLRYEHHRPTSSEQRAHLSQSMLWVAKYLNGRSYRLEHAEIEAVCGANLVRPGTSSVLKIEPLSFNKIELANYDDPRSAPGVYGCALGQRLRSVRFVVQGLTRSEGLNGIVLTHIRRQVRLDKQWRRDALKISDGVKKKMDEFAIGLYLAAHGETTLDEAHQSARARMLVEARRASFEEEVQDIDLAPDLSSPWVAVRKVLDGNQPVFNIQVGQISVGDHLVFLDFNRREFATQTSQTTPVLCFEVGQEEVSVIERAYSEASPELAPAEFRRKGFARGRIAASDIGDGLKSWAAEIGLEESCASFAPVLAGVAETHGIQLFLNDDHWRRYERDPAPFCVAGVLGIDTTFAETSSSGRHDAGVVTRTLQLCGNEASLPLSPDMETQAKALILLWENRDNSAFQQAMKICADMTVGANAPTDVDQIAEQFEGLDVMARNTAFLEVLKMDDCAPQRLQLLGLTQAEPVPTRQIADRIADLRTYYKDFCDVNAEFDGAEYLLAGAADTSEADIKAAKLLLENLENSRKRKEQLAAAKFRDKLATAGQRRGLVNLIIQQISRDFPNIRQPGDEKVDKLYEEKAPRRPTKSDGSPSRISRAVVGDEFLVQSAREKVQEIEQDIETLTDLSASSEERVRDLVALVAANEMSAGYEYISHVLKRATEAGHPVPLDLRRRLCLWPLRGQETLEAAKQLDGDLLKSEKTAGDEKAAQEEAVA